MVNLEQVTETQKAMIEEYQCPGCVSGIDIQCGSFQFHAEEGCFRCQSHVPGTTVIPGGTIQLGLPKGFNRLGPQARTEGGKIRLWEKDSHPDWNDFNVPVWAMERDGILFVRTYMPRVNYPMVDIVQGGTLQLCPRAIDVGNLEMD